VKVYLNYLLSREGQYELSKAMKLPSRRLDVPQDHLPETVYPIKQGMKIQNTYNEASVRVRVKARKFVISILKK
jgi:ABC-type Fe3+ transport system substrate-binding protein